MLNENVAAKRAIHRCCSSSQDTLHVPPEHRRFRRVNGLQLPLHPQQVTGWVLLVVVFVGTFTVLTTPPLPLLLLPDLRLALSFLYAALFLAHVFAHLTVLLLDPADPEVRARPASEVVPEFDRSKHRHVIENGRCHLCNITTRGRRTKHCSICNKCVPRFDHHCKWLNNCIGGRNYPAFLVCLVSTLVTALAVAGLALGELVLVHVRVVDWGGNNDTMNNATASSSLPAPGAGSLVLVTIIGVLSAIAAVLLIHLCFFHGYIACLGLTTYEYVRNKREKSSGAAAAAAATSRTSSSGPCGAPHCAANEENVETVGARGLYRLCENGPLFRDGATTTTTMTTATTDVYVCSTHEERGDTANGSRDSLCSRLSSTRGSRNFRLCFSYDSRTTETSIEVSSRTTESGNHHGESPDAKSSTPSPVSCCFSIMNSPAEGGRHEKSANRNRRSSDGHSETAKRSCGTMRRIQTFLQARLRKSSSRQRSTTSTSAVARPCGNKIIPATDSPINVAPANEDQLVEQLTPTTELTSLPDPRPPVRLPALDLPPRAIHKIGVPAGAGDISVLGSIPVAMPKRNQTHLRTRRNTLSRKRPRFKIGSHITQTAQLSPIPESEFSKPATPRSPSRSDHFAFPSLRE